MGEVFLALDTRLDRKVAIKFLTGDLSNDPTRIRRFFQEAKAASALNHPNILTVYEIGESEGRHFIATEFIEGKTLREYFHPVGKLRLQPVLEVAVQIAEALDAAHRAGIVHRDIKPENIMVRDDGYAKVLDFGLAKLSDARPKAAGEVSADEETLSQIHTMPGMIMGTARYMSPEQARGREVDSRTDIFSLGVVLYELLTRQKPFTGESGIHALLAVIEKRPPSFAECGANVPAELERITMRSLEKDPGRRYQKASEMAADLRAFLRHLEFGSEIERSSAPDVNGEARTEVLGSTSVRSSDLRNTVAVLPFANMSPGEDGDYFSDGLAEELLNVLSKIRGLRVAARTSAFSFKGKQATITEIGRALNVGSVLEGSIRTAGDRVRIAVQLVNVLDGYQLWSKTYDRTMDDIFAVQDEIAGTVVEELRAMLVGEDFDAAPGTAVMAEVAEAVRGRAADPEAQRLMLLGRHFLDRTTREDSEKAVEYFKQALAIDPGFALGWAELGHANALQAGKSWAPIEEGFSNARRAIERALELEPDLAEAHAYLGRIQAAYDLDIESALSSYERALRLAPRNSVVMDGAAILKFKLGRSDEALELIRGVVEQDPLSGAVWHNLGFVCHSTGRLDEAERAFGRAVELNPLRQMSIAMLALVYLDQGRNELALQKADEEPDEFWRLWAKAIVFSSLERTADSDEQLAELLAIHSEGDAYQIAEVHAMRGEIDKAFEWLERAFAIRDPGITHANADPRFRPLQVDPRWPALLKRIGFDR